MKPEDITPEHIALYRLFVTAYSSFKTDAADVPRQNSLNRLFEAQQRELFGEVQVWFLPERCGFDGNAPAGIYEVEKGLSNLLWEDKDDI